MAIFIYLYLPHSRSCSIFLVYPLLLNFHKFIVDMMKLHSLNWSRTKNTLTLQNCKIPIQALQAYRSTKKKKKKKLKSSKLISFFSLIYIFIGNLCVAEMRHREQCWLNLWYPVLSIQQAAPPLRSLSLPLPFSLL